MSGVRRSRAENRHPRQGGRPAYLRAVLLALGLILLGLAAAFVPVALKLPDLPLAVPFLLMGIGVIAGWAAVVKKFTWKRAVGSSLLTLVVGFQLLWVLVLSAYAHPENATGLNEEAPAFAARRVRDGAPFHPLAMRGDRFLLVFFRGAW